MVISEHVVIGQEVKNGQIGNDVGGLQVKGSIGETSGDFDTKTEQGIYNIAFGTQAAHSPGIDWGLLLVFKGNFIVQLAIGVVNNTATTLIKARYSDAYPIKFSEWSI